MKKILLAAFLLLSTVSAQPVLAASVSVTATMNYMAAATLTSTQNMTFKLSKNDAKAGVYNFATDASLGFSGKTIGQLTSAAVMTPAIFAITMNPSALVMISIPTGLILSDGSGHVATFVINAYGAFTGDFSSVQYDAPMGSNGATPFSATFPVGVDGKYFIALAPKFVSFAAGNDIAGAGWTGTIQLTVDYI